MVQRSPIGSQEQIPDLFLGQVQFFTTRHLMESFHTVIPCYVPYSPIGRTAAEAAKETWPQPAWDARQSSLKPALLPQPSQPPCGPRVAGSLRGLWHWYWVVGVRQESPRYMSPAGRGRSPFFCEVHVSLQFHLVLRGGRTGQHCALGPAARPHHPAEKQAGGPGETNSLNTPFRDR